MFQGFFNYDNDVWRFVGRLADMMILNLLWILFSLPIVTLGASTTALYYCTIKIVHEEDRGNFRMFMHSFKQNLKEGIILWMILLPILVILLLDHRFFSMIFADNTALRFLFRGITDALLLLWLFVFLYVWPLLSRFDNTWQRTLIHALLMSIRHLPYTLGMIAADVLLVVGSYFLILFMPMFTPVFFVLGYPLIAWMNSAFFKRIFRLYEKKMEVRDPFEEKVYGKREKETETAKEEEK